MDEQSKSSTIVTTMSTASERVHLVSVFVHRQEQLHPEAAAALENLVKVSVEGFLKAWSL